MNIAFRDKKTQKVFNSGKALNKEYGRNAPVIKRRMAVLSASITLNDVPKTKPERCHLLKGDTRGQFAVDLKHPFRLIFEPNHEPVPKKEDGGIDLQRVTSITIINVEDYH